MPHASHELLKQCMTDIFTRLQLAGWKYNGSPITFQNTHSATCTLILGDNKTKEAQPDYSIRVEGATFPFIVAENANKQDSKSLKAKNHNWVQGSRSQLKFLCVLAIKNVDGKYKVLASVIKPTRQDKPTKEKPENYVMVQQRIIDDVEIYPKASKLSFTIKRADVLPVHAKHDGQEPEEGVEIELVGWYAIAQGAIDNLVKGNYEDYDSRDPNQEFVYPSSSSSEGASFASEESNNDDPRDRSYRGDAGVAQS
ncbi:MAG: hypothetical protein Q9222_000814 [Ikaeria aurantiellina]